MDVFRDNGPVNKIQVYGKVDGESFLEYSVSDPNARGLQVITYVESFQYITNIDHLRELAEKLADEKFAKIDISKISKVDRKDWHILPDDYKPHEDVYTEPIKINLMKIIGWILICIGIVLIPFILLTNTPIGLIGSVLLFWACVLSILFLITADKDEDEGPAKKSPYDNLGRFGFHQEYELSLTDIDHDLDSKHCTHKFDPYTYHCKKCGESRVDLDRQIRCDHDWEKITSIGGEFKIHLCRKCGKTKDDKIDVSKIKVTRYCSYCGVKLPKSVGECPYCGKFDDVVYNSKLFWRKGRKEHSDWTKKGLKPARRPL